MEEHAKFQWASQGKVLARGGTYQVLADTVAQAEGEGHVAPDGAALLLLTRPLHSTKCCGCHHTSDYFYMHMYGAHGSCSPKNCIRPKTLGVIMHQASFTLCMYMVRRAAAAVFRAKMHLKPK